jgi:glycosyltransferase involved in cell wall biosynthesis
MNAYSLAKEAKKAGHEVSFILGKEKYLAEKLKKDNISYTFIPMYSSFNPVAVLNSIFEFKKYFAKNKTDIVHTHMLREHSLAIGAKFLGAKIKVVRTFHRLDQFNLKMIPLLWFYRWQTDRFIAVSNYMENYLKNNGISSKISTVYNGVPKVEVEKHEKNIGYLGRISREKGIVQFVENNLKELKKTKLVVGGNGPMLDDLKEVVSANSLNVEILGAVNDLKDFFEKIDRLILPSRTEALPLVVLDAFSCGVPVVAFELSPLKELIDDENGKLVEKADYNKLFQTAKNLDVSKYKNKVIKTYEEKYNIGKMWQATEKVYKEVEA